MTECKTPSYLLNYPLLPLGLPTPLDYGPRAFSASRQFLKLPEYGPTAFSVGLTPVFKTPRVSLGCLFSASRQLSKPRVRPLQPPRSHVSFQNSQSTTLRLCQSASRQFQNSQSLSAVYSRPHVCFQNSQSTALRPSRPQVSFQNSQGTVRP